MTPTDKPRKDIVVLMTAAVSTRGMVGACFSDEQRELMYAEALNFYITDLLTDPNRKIVFAENSGWDLISLKNRLRGFDEKRIEFISLDANDFDISRGKGYNEMLMINQAIDKSKLIDDETYFFKVTGRYPIYNLKYLIRKAESKIARSGVKLYADIKDHNLYERLGLGWCGHSFDCRLFAVEKRYYKERIAPLYKLCDDYGRGKLMEEILFNFVKSEMEENMSQRFPREPRFGGLEGSDVQAVSYSMLQDSIKGRLKRHVGNLIRMTMPGFKF